MKAALSIVLAATLVTTPLKLVLAQAAEQEAATVQQTAPPDSSGHRLIVVPPVTDNTSRLWEPLASEDALAGIFAYDDSQSRPRMPPVPRAVVVVVVILLLLFIIFVIVCGDPEPGTCCLC